MSMSITDLKAQAEAGLSITPGTQKAAILRVLASNPDTAFTPKKMADRAGIPADNAPTVCRRLVEMGVATNRNGYYHLPEDDEVAAAVVRALGSAHQRDMAQKTAEADEANLASESGDSEAEPVSDAEVDAELAAIDDPTES